MSNPSKLDLIQARHISLDDSYKTGCSCCKPSEAHVDRGDLLAALRAVEAMHRNEARDSFGRPADASTGHGGWCYRCGRYDGAHCPEITAIRDALA
jgi:hypothetical protein